MTYKVIDTDIWTEEALRDGVTTQEKIDKGAEKLWRKCQRYKKRQEFKKNVKRVLLPKRTRPQERPHKPFR